MSTVLPGAKHTVIHIIANICHAVVTIFSSAITKALRRVDSIISIIASIINILWHAATPT